MQAMRTCALSNMPIFTVWVGQGAVHVIPMDRPEAYVAMARAVRSAHVRSRHAWVWGRPVRLCAARSCARRDARCAARSPHRLWALSGTAGPQPGCSFPKQGKRLPFPLLGALCLPSSVGERCSFPKQAGRQCRWAGRNKLLDLKRAALAHTPSSLVQPCPLPCLALPLSQGKDCLSLGSPSFLWLSLCRAKKGEPNPFGEPL